jgi:hypothetical protein
VSVSHTRYPSGNRTSSIWVRRDATVASYTRPAAQATQRAKDRNPRCQKLLRNKRPRAETPGRRDSKWTTALFSSRPRGLCASARGGEAISPWLPTENIGQLAPWATLFRSSVDGLARKAADLQSRSATHLLKTYGREPFFSRYARRQ